MRQTKFQLLQIFVPVKSEHGRWSIREFNGEKAREKLSQVHLYRSRSTFEVKFFLSPISALPNTTSYFSSSIRHRSSYSCQSLQPQFPTRLVPLLSSGDCFQRTDAHMAPLVAVHFVKSKQLGSIYMVSGDRGNFKPISLQTSTKSLHQDREPVLGGRVVSPRQVTLAGENLLMYSTCRGETTRPGVVSPPLTTRRHSIHQALVI